MSENASNDSLRLGFLTAIEVPDNGFVGGLLVTNRFGRPLEFQCTTPVKPNRTQTILYGPTLVPYIVGELIGRTLVEKVGISPHLILTDYPEMLELRSHVPIPVACLDSETIIIKTEPVESVSRTAQSPMQEESPQPLNLTTPTQADPPRTHDETVGLAPSSEGVSLGRQFLRFHSEHASDAQIVRQQARRIPPDADLREPLDRVREALSETIHTGAVR